MSNANGRGRRARPDIDEAEVKIAEAWAKKARLDVLACRQFGHSWGQGITAMYRLGPSHYARDLHCTRCGMERIDAWPVGEYGIAKRWYIKPKDYSRERGVGETVRIPRRVVHEAMMQRSKTLAPPEHIQELYDRWA